MNLFEQRLYNCYLKAVRGNNGQPFKFRQDFDGFEEKPEYAMIQKINLFMIKFPHIDPQDFFNAPYEIHPDTGYLELKFYTTQKAISLWALAQKKKQNLAPDTPEQNDFLIKSLKYIASFCVENKILLESYAMHTDNGVLTCGKHFKNKEVSIYSLISLGNFEDAYNKIDDTQKELLFDNIDLVTFKIRYYQSQYLKDVGSEAVKRIRKYIEENVSAQGK